MTDFSKLAALLEEQARRRGSDSQFKGRIISPVIQHSKLGAFGGLGDFVSQTSMLFPHIEWAVPLTEKIRAHIGDELSPSIAVVPVTLFDPVTGEAHQFAFDLHPHIQDNGSLTWLFHCAELMEPLATYKTILSVDRSTLKRELKSEHRFFGLRINQNSYQHACWTDTRATVANTPGLRRIHPLLRRYIDNPDMLNVIMQSAMSKAVVELLAKSGVSYDIVWVQDWHFAGIAGELLQPANKGLAKRLRYVQHLHNVLYQGVYSAPELIDVLGWPKTHFTKTLYRVHGQVNLLGGALNALRFNLLDGQAVAVSENHATELPTVERGAGLHHIFKPLRSRKRLAGINNPIMLPQDLPITNEGDIEELKPRFKQAVQEYFGLEVRPDTFLLLWTHRFTHQKQVGAVLQALKSVLKDGNRDLQVAFFCDLDQGSNPDDVRKLRQLIKRYPKNIANRAFDPKQEMRFAAGVDGALMASYFEPFGYAPIWVGMQGGFVITGANGGQLDIFDPKTTFFIDVEPDIDKPKQLSGTRLESLYEYLFVSNTAYRKRTFKKNTRNIKKTILAAKAQFRDAERRKIVKRLTMRRTRELAESKAFAENLNKLIIEGALAPATTRNPAPETSDRHAARMVTDTWNHILQPFGRGPKNAKPEIRPADLPDEATSHRSDADLRETAN